MDNAQICGSARRVSHLERLEAEAIHVIREVAAGFSRPVLLYSIGKDSSVLLHLAIKAFRPGKLPFPVMHIDTNWKFREMLAFRDQTAKDLDLDLIVYTNEEGLANNIDPFVHGPDHYTHVMKTDALRQALDKYEFDGALGGARRDEDRSRAKERIFSFRDIGHVWDPKNQRPEMWKTFNTNIGKGQSARIFPLSNWTELDIWQYIFFEKIPIVPLYFAAKRPTVVRDGMLIMRDDERMPLADGEVVQDLVIRFRTLGCYPLTGGFESTAQTVADIIHETISMRTSERQNRAIDRDGSGSLERKKREGYF